MIKVPQEIQELFKRDSVSKNFRVHFPNGEFRDLVNKDFVSESVIFTESISSGNAIKFGEVEKSSIEFKMYFPENIKRKLIYCGIEIDITELDEDFIEDYGETSEDVPYPYYFVPYGYFVVQSCVMDKQDIQSVVAYQAGVTPGELGFPPVEYAKLYEPFSLRFWADILLYGLDSKDGEKSNANNYVYIISKEKFFAESYNSCEHLNNSLVDTYTENDDILNPSVNRIRSLKVLEVPTDTWFWNMPQMLYNDGQTMRSDPYYSGLSQDVAIHIKGIQLHFDTEKIYTYNYNDLGLEVNNSRQFVNNYAELPAKNYLYELSWKNDIPQNISREQFNRPEIYDVLGPEIISELIKPCLKFEYYTPRPSSSKGVNSSSGSINLYLGSEFSTLQLYLGDDGSVDSDYSLRPINLIGYSGSTSVKNDIFDLKPSGALLPEGIRYRFADPISGYIYPIMGKYSDASRYEFQYANCVYMGAKSSQNFCNFDVPNSNGEYKLVINPYVHIADLSEGTDVEPTIRVTNYTPHISISIPTEMVIIYGTDANKTSTNTRSFDICDQSPMPNRYEQQIIPLNSWINPKLKKFQIEDEYSDVITVPVGPAIVEHDDNYWNERLSSYIISYPGAHKYYLYRKLYKSDQATGVENTCIRCKLDILNAISLGDSSYISNIAEASALFLVSMRNKFSDNYRLLSLVDDDAALYPDDTLYPDDSLYPLGASFFTITRSMWYKLSVDTLEKSVYDRVCCTIVIDGESQYFESRIFDITEEYALDTYSSYDLSNNLYIKNGIFDAETIQSMLDTIAYTIRKIYYQTAILTIKGLPYLEPGDKLRVLTKDSSVTTYILRHRLHGIQSLIDEIETR